LILKHLSLTNFRNYPCLELDLAPGVSIFWGGNAQGKTNFLEAVYFLSTARPVGPVAERELVNWSTWQEKTGFCRLSARVDDGGSQTRLEILLLLRGGDLPQVRRIIRVNGVVRRAMELVGRLRTVMFSPRDIALIGGEPVLRRRWLDILNAQLSPRYLRSLLRYTRVLNQRNKLLKAIGAQRATSTELDFWDRELVETGSYLILQRQQVLQKLSPLTQGIHRELTRGKEKLELLYRPSISVYDHFVSPSEEPSDLQEIKRSFGRSLEENRKREIMQGVSLIGPHRDDLRFGVGGVDMGAYGSRGQQRTIALSLRLGEARFMLRETGKLPVLLLDDVLSELDEERRGQLLKSVLDYQQVLITATELDRFPADFLSRAARFKVEGGRVESLASAANSAC